MQLDLIEAIEVIEEKPTAETLEEPKQLHIGQQLASVLSEYEAALTHWAYSTASFSTYEQSVMPCESYMAAFKPLRTAGVQVQLKVVGRNIRSRMVRYAENKFAPSGHKLSIDQSEFPAEFQIERENDFSFDPAAFWEYLEREYSGAAGADLAWAQAARSVINAFNMRRSNKVETKGRYVILNDRIHIDDFDKKYGRMKPCYSSQQSIADCCMALAGFARWAGLNALASDLHGVQMHFCYHSSAVESRKQFKCGNGEIVVVTFQSNFEYRIEQDVATQLQLFIGKFAPNEMRA